MSSNEEEADLMSLVVFLAKYQCDLNKLRTSTFNMEPEEVKDAIIMKWPVIQGTRSQINLERIGEMKSDPQGVARAVSRILEYKQLRQEVKV